MGLLEGGSNPKKSEPATEKTSPCNVLENDRTTSTSRYFMG